MLGDAVVNVVIADREGRPPAHAALHRRGRVVIVTAMARADEPSVEAITEQIFVPGSQEAGVIKDRIEFLATCPGRRRPRPNAQKRPRLLDMVSRVAAAKNGR